MLITTTNSKPIVELRYNRQHKRKEREKDLARHKEKEQEVQKVYDSLGSAKKRKGKGKDKNRKQSLPCFEPTANTRFHLYSTHYITHGPYKSPFPSQYIEFYYSYSIDLPGPEGQYGGHIYIDYGTEYAFQPFFPPKHASLDKHLLKTWDGRHSLTIQFIGDNYLKLKLLRELVRVNESVSQHSMPDLFEFVGIRPGFEMEREERGRAQAKRKRSPSPPSPRESWFEMNHPMEWWNQSRGF
jgi:hypothetical protein